MKPACCDSEERLPKLGDAPPRLESIVDGRAFRTLLKVMDLNPRKSKGEEIDSVDYFNETGSVPITGSVGKYTGC
jgi:hypothetical protein